MEDADLAAVAALSTRVHPNFPERPEVLTEKFRLFPHGCFALSDGRTIAGYCFSHPWKRGTPPPALDAFLGEIPRQADSFFIHDLTLDTSMRRRNLAATLVPALVQAARDTGVTHMTLVAVNGASPFWSRMGFERTPDEAIQAAARKKYDAGAIHMQRTL
jgi:GNAT superfamily N-acetyltransferase